jgi:hypothetical protein
MGKRPKCDLDTAYIKLCNAIESMKDALAYAQMALVEMPPPVHSKESFDEPTYIGGENG